MQIVLVLASRDESDSDGTGENFAMPLPSSVYPPSSPVSPFLPLSPKAVIPSIDLGPHIYFSHFDLSFLQAQTVSP